jgi:CDP-glucose 4,6-dehydratase
VPDLVRAAQDRTPLTLRHPEAVRPWQHVLNPLSGYLLLAERLLAGDDVAEAWNFGPDPEDALPVGEVVERLRARWPGTPPEVRTQPGDGREATLLRLDSTKARTRLGWTPRWDLDRGLEATVEHYAGDDPERLTLAQIDAYV